MEKAKINKRILNLKKVKAIVEIAKIDTLQKIAQTNNVKKHHYEMALKSQQIINYSKTLNKWSNKLNDLTSRKQKKTLWLYMTISSVLIKVSYTRYEKIISKDFNPEHDAIIPIGEPAINFSNNQNYKKLAEFANLENTNIPISSIVMHAIQNEKFDNIFIVSASTKSKDSFFRMYPFGNVSFNKKEMLKKKFYYSLSDTLEQISYSYVKNIISGIYQESYKNFYTEKLAKHESSLNSIDEKMHQLKLSVIKDERKVETEEMIQVIQSVKRK